jgi:hypothetical protein
MQTLTVEQLIEFIQAGVERPDLDYKEDIELGRDKKEQKARLAKDIIAMANTDGGVIVGGVKELSSGFEFSGMSEQSLQDFDSTAINDFVSNYCDPPINATSRIIPIGDNRFGVLVVPEFNEQPHIVTKNYSEVFSEADLLVRSSSNNSVRAGPNELRQMLNKATMRRQGALRDFLQVALSTQAPKLVGQGQTHSEIQAPFDRDKYKDMHQGFRIVTIAVAPTFPAVRPMALRAAVLNATVNRRTGYSSFPSANLDATAETRLRIGIAYEQDNQYKSGRLGFSYFGTNGGIFDAESLWEDSPSQSRPTNGVGLLSCFQFIYSSLLFSRRYYPALGFAGDCEMRFALESSVPRVLFVDSNDFWPSSRQYINDMSLPLAVETTLSMSSTLADIEKLAADMIIEYCWYFHFDINTKNATDFLEYIKQKWLDVPAIG